MPYGSTSELPAYVKKLPATSQRKWMHVFNSCMENGGDEARCFRMANGVAKKEVGDFEPEGEFVSDEYDLALFEKAFPFVDNSNEEPAVLIGEDWLDENKLRRAEMDESSFAYIDKNGNRKLPIHTAAHVRNALARFNQTQFDSPEARRRARAKIRAAARRFGIEVSDDNSKGLVTQLAELLGFATPEPTGSAQQDGVTAPPLPELEARFGVIKQANGKLRWFARYSNAWEEIGRAHV